jgi:hypothetical protein
MVTADQSPASNLSGGTSPHGDVDTGIIPDIVTNVNDESTPKVVLSELLKSYPLDLNLNEMTGTYQTGELKVPWANFYWNGTTKVALPTNYDLIIKGYLLHRIYLHFLQKTSEVEIQLLDIADAPKVKLDLGSETILRSISVFFFAEKLPKCPQGKGVYARGQTLAFHIWLEGQSNVDSTLFKKAPQTSLVKEFLSDPFSKTVKTEKTILDFLTNCIRKKKFSSTDNISSWLKDKQSLAKEKGLDIAVTNNIFSSGEKSFIKEFISHSGTSQSYEGDAPEPKNFGEIQSFQDSIRNRQKAIRDVKITLKRISSIRLTSLYPPGVKEKDRIRISKIPIRELMNTYIEKRDNLEPFNPTLIYQLIGISCVPFSIVKLKNDGVYSSPGIHTMNSYEDDFLKAGIKSQTLRSIIEEWITLSPKEYTD